MLVAKSMKKTLRQTFSVFEHQYLKMRNYKYSFNQNFIILWQMELVWVFCFLFCVGTFVYSNFWLCDYCDE